MGLVYCVKVGTSAAFGVPISGGSRALTSVAFAGTIRLDFVRHQGAHLLTDFPCSLPMFALSLIHAAEPACLSGHLSTSAIFSVVIRCGGFRALYGWLGDVWERVRAHKMARAGPPDWMGVGGRVYVEDLLCVLARVPISVDMLRETVRRRCHASGLEVQGVYRGVICVCCSWKIASYRRGRKRGGGSGLHVPRSSAVVVCAYVKAAEG